VPCHQYETLQPTADVVLGAFSPKHWHHGALTSTNHSCPYVGPYWYTSTSLRSTLNLHAFQKKVHHGFTSSTFYHTFLPFAVLPNLLVVALSFVWNEMIHRANAKKYTRIRGAFRKSDRLKTNLKNFTLPGMSHNNDHKEESLSNMFHFTHLPPHRRGDEELRVPHHSVHPTFRHQSYLGH
jgi:hypothetical protein